MEAEGELQAAARGVRELFDLCQSRKVCSFFQKIGRQISVGK